MIKNKTSSIGNEGSEKELKLHSQDSNFPLKSCSLCSNIVSGILKPKKSPSNQLFLFVFANNNNNNIFFNKYIYIYLFTREHKLHNINYIVVNNKLILSSLKGEFGFVILRTILLHKLHNISYRILIKFYTKINKNG